MSVVIRMLNGRAFVRRCDCSPAGLNVKCRGGVPQIVLGYPWSASRSDNWPCMWIIEWRSSESAHVNVQTSEARRPLSQNRLTIAESGWSTASNARRWLMVWHCCSGAVEVIGSENATGFDGRMRLFPPCRNTIENTLRPNAGMT